MTRHTEHALQTGVYHPGQRLSARSISRLHATRRDLGMLPGVGHALIEDSPGASTSGLCGGKATGAG